MTDEYARAATLNDLKTLLRSLNEHGVEYVLIGGYALAAHGHIRATTDIDVLVPGNAQAGMKLIKALMVLPDQVAKDIEPEWFDEGENIRVADEFIVDVMLNANGYTYEALSRYAETTDLEGIPVRTLNLQGLLLTKQTMRDKDVADRHIIERALAVMGASQAEQEAALDAAVAASRDFVIAELLNHVEREDISDAKPEQNSRTAGTVVAATDHHVGQYIGRAAVIHRRVLLDGDFAAGQNVSIQYRNGRGAVEVRQQDKNQSKSRGRRP